MARRRPEWLRQEYLLQSHRHRRLGRIGLVINPDLLARRIADREEIDIDPANRLAVERMEAWLRSSIEVYQTIGVETVLSTFKYRALVRLAKAKGFEVRLVYIFIRSLEGQIRRIADRERDGGHHVPRHKIAPRRSRSFRQLAWFLRKADTAYLFDNSGSELKMVAEKSRGTLHWLEIPPRDMIETFRELQMPIPGA